MYLNRVFYQLDMKLVAMDTFFRTLWELKSYHTHKQYVSHTKELIFLIKTKVSSNLPGFTAVTGVPARVNVKRQHSLSDLHFIPMLEYIRVTLSFGLKGKKIIKQTSKSYIWLFILWLLYIMSDYNQKYWDGSQWDRQTYAYIPISKTWGWYIIFY